jgi:hypothetical protein
VVKRPAGTGTGGIPQAACRAAALLLLAAFLAGCTAGGLRFSRNRAGTRSISLPDPWQEAVREEYSWLEEPRERASLEEAVPPPAGGEVPAGEYAGPVPEIPFPEAPAAGPARVSPGDVVKIEEKFFIAQTNDVYLNPGDYLGKTIRLEGIFKQVEYEGGGGYCIVLRYGPGCCGNDGSAGFEVSWDRTDPNPPPYPGEDEWVEAEGVLDYYREDDYPYLYLDLLSLRVKETRGAEFVSQ